MHCESNLITVQQDATHSVYYISVGSSTSFNFKFIWMHHGVLRYTQEMIRQHNSFYYI